MERIIRIASDYTKTPGGRHKKEGNYSGEDFRESLLFPLFKESLEKDQTLIIDLDGGFGYGSSFLEEAFGGLARMTHDRRILNIQIISEEEPRLVQDIKQYMEDALNEGQARL